MSAVNQQEQNLEHTVVPEKKKSICLDVWRRLRKNKAAMVGLGIVILLFLVAIFADVIAPYTYFEQDLRNRFALPSAAHWFGTDEFGRDIFSRVVHGSRISLVVGFLTIIFSVALGGLLGALAGFYGGFTDNIIMRFTDVILAIPNILLAIAIVAALGNDLNNIMIAVGIGSMPQYARILRASVLTLRDQEFVEAARASGANDFRLITKHIIPNALAPIIVQATLGVATAILTVAALSFIGIGLSPPTPEWGAMLSSGRQYLRDFTHLTTFPGLAIMIVILGLNMFGDGLRDALDPKLKD
jgi:peptide/nickel transport system permease protein